MSETIEIKSLSRQDIVANYPFTTKRSDEIGSCFFMIPLERQLSEFVRGLGRITYFKTIKRDLETTPFVEEFESLENRKDVMYQMVTDYVLIKEFLHKEDCECGTCTPETRVGLIKLDGFEDCYLGVAESYADHPALVYDYEQIINKLKQDMSEEEALEYYEFNILGSYIGEKMPLFLNKIPLEDLGIS
jgi:hypothetical protein